MQALELGTQITLVHQLFEAQVMRSPYAIAVESLEQSLTYRELNDRANQLAYHLQTLGVGPDALVGLCTERSPDMIIAMLAIFKAGGAYVPLDPTYPAERLAYMLNTAQVQVLLTQKALAQALPTAGMTVFCLDTDQSAIAHYNTTNPHSETQPEHLAYVIYTSGSTGQPKGVAMPHCPLTNLIDWQLSHSQIPAGKTLQFAPISFDVSFQEIISTLAAGGTLILVPEMLRRDPLHLLHFLADNQIERLFLPFIALQYLAEVADAEGIVLNALREVITAGEQLRITTAIARWFAQLPQCTLHNHYGPSESHVVTAYTLTGNPANWPLLPAIGCPIANAEAHVLDETLHPVPNGTPGELYIGGACLARGYLNQPGLTAERFINSPSLGPERGLCQHSNTSTLPIADSRLYKTGDLVRALPDGNLEYLGRIDQQVKIRGYRIEPGEVEAALEQHPNVREAVVMAREDVPGDKRLVAYVVAEGDQSEMGLRPFLQARLPEYMVPSHVVWLEQFPLTPSGKIDRRSLPVPQYQPDLAAVAAPQTSLEASLVSIWSEVLGIGQVGIHDRFLDLGGHSLLAVQVVSRIRDRLQVELPLLTLLGSPTIHELAQQISTLQLASPIQVLQIQPVERDRPLPLSIMQESLWFLDQWVPNHPFYNVPEAFRLNGHLDIAALEQSLQTILQRHEALRTNIAIADGKPLQVIQPVPLFQLPIADLSQASDPEALARQYITQEAQQPFDLAQDVLLRVKLFKLSPTEWILFFNLHHIVCDGWSISILLQELSTLYVALSQGQASPLPPLNIQYADAAMWQRQWLEGVRAHQLSYWQRQLEHLPSLQLPTDLPKPTAPTYRGARYEVTLSASLTQHLKELSRQEGTTLFMTLLGAFQTLLFRYTGQVDFPIGTLVANRPCSDLESLIGFFINTLVLRTDASGAPSFRDLLHRVRQVTLEAYAHPDLPFEELVQALHPNRDLNQNPLVQVLLNVQNAPAAAWEVTDLKLTPLSIDNQTAKFDLLLELNETPEGLVGFFEYSTDLFKAETIARLVRHLETLLGGIVENPDRVLADLPLFTEADYHQWATWNHTPMALPPERCVHHLVEAQVSRTPDAVAITFADQRLTYQELNQRANQLAHYLQGIGVGPNVLVGICVERSLDLIVGLLGILKAGGAYVPLDPAYPQERLAFMLDDAQVQVLLTQEALLAHLPSHQATVICLDRDWSAIATCPTNNPQSSVTPDDLAYILYTSGSTGTPKGVQIEQRSLVNLLTYMQQEPGLTAQDTLLAVTTISFDIAGVEMYLPLTVGARTVLVSRDVAADALQLVKTLEQSGATFMQATPATWRLLLSAGWQGDPQLRIVCCGEALPRELANQLLERTHTLWNMYGPTETTIYSTIHRVEPVSGPVPIGRPIANTQIHLLAQSGDSLQPVPVGVPGELYIGGTGVARGYLNRPDLTAERFTIASSLPAPIAPLPHQPYLYKTGDLARYRADGTIEYLGRIDHQVKIRGYRIELGDIEAALCHYPAVKEAVAIAREDQPGDQRLVAYIVPQTLAEGSVASQLSTHELRSFLKQKLPEFMIPAAFVVMERLPLTPNGKVDRRTLPAPDLSRSNAQDWAAPRTPTEQQLAEIWSQALGVERIGIHDNFFDLGGHSLLAAQILFRSRETFQVELALRHIFLAPTVAELGQLIEAQITPAAGTIAAETTPTLDLHAEAVLAPSIHPNGAAIANLSQPIHVFLTGATGFLGNFLLHEILVQTQASVYCLVRANVTETASQRLQQSLEAYGLWNPEYSHRIIPVAGDLALPQFGLSDAQFERLAEIIDVIYHNGSWVNFVYPYSVLKTANVLGTQEVLRLASQTKVKSVHFLSSLGVFAPMAYEDGQVLKEQDWPDRTTGLYGYTQTKWVAEQLIRTAHARGIPASIYRPAWIEGHSRTGVCNHGDFLRSLMKGCLQLGVAPDWKMPVDIVPVDFVSRAIVHLSLQNSSYGKAFNLSNPTQMTWNQLVTWMQSYGYKLQHVPYAVWQQEVIDRVSDTPSNALYPYLSFLSEPLPEYQMTVPEIYFQTSWLQFESDNVKTGLADTTIAYPVIDHELLNTYFSYFIRSGFLEPPCAEPVMLPNPIGLR